MPPFRRRFVKFLLAGAAALSLSLASPQPGSAQEQAKPLSVWDYSLYKTITYEVFTTIGDLVLYYAVLGGVGVTGGAWFTAVNTASAATYYVYEAAWNLYGPLIRDLPPSTAVNVELIKTLGYRVVNTAGDLVIGYAFSGTITASIGYALLGNISDGALYLANEYAWYAYGPAQPGASAPIKQTAPDVAVAQPADDAYLVSAIAIGAVAGAIVANVATSGMAAPVLALGTPAVTAALTSVEYFGAVATTAIGATVGAYVAEWLYPR